MTQQRTYFQDLEEMHRKFEMATGATDMSLPKDLLLFRIKFMLEELIEYAQALGYELVVRDLPLKLDSVSLSSLSDVVRNPAHEDAMDSLIDLVVVALGTAELHKYPFDEGWKLVHAANMAKERGVGKRRFGMDLVKPLGWRPPDHGPAIAARLKELREDV